MPDPGAETDHQVVLGIRHQEMEGIPAHARLHDEPAEGDRGILREQIAERVELAALDFHRRAVLDHDTGRPYDVDPVYANDLASRSHDQAEARQRHEGRTVDQDSRHRREGVALRRDQDGLPVACELERERADDPDRLCQLEESRTETDPAATAALDLIDRGLNRELPAVVALRRDAGGAAAIMASDIGR